MNLAAEAEQRARERRRQRLRLIVDAASGVLAEVGPDGTTLDEVGQRVGMSKSALYYYVDSKQQLMALVLETILEDIRAEATRVAADGADPLQRLRTFAHAHVRAAVERPAGQLVVSTVDLLAADAVTAELLRSHQREALDVVAEAVAAGQLRDVPDLVVAPVLFGTLNAIPRMFDTSGPRPLAEVVDRALDLILDGWRTTTADERHQGS